MALLSMRRSRALDAQPTTAGGKLLEKRYGRERWRSKSMRGLGPVVYPPADGGQRNGQGTPG